MVNHKKYYMKHLINLFFGCIFLTSCKKENITTRNNSAICFETSFLNTNIQDGLISVFFLNGKDGFVAGYNGGIYKTTDSAKNWAALNSTTNLPIRDIYFFNSNTGIAVGGLNSCGGAGCIPPGGFILRTRDAGQTWNQIYTPSNKLEITSVYFINNLTGFCVGDNVIYKTTDGGKSWAENQINNLGGKMMKIKFSDRQNGFIVCLFGKILRTIDGGNTWQITTPGKNIGYYSLSSSNGKSYVSGQGKILKSVDNGITWNEIAGSPSDIYDIHFSTQNIGYAFGRGDYSGGDFGSSYGSMYCTDNGGNTWSGNGNFKDVGLIQAVSFPSGKTGYAVSENKVIKIIVN
jgi:photosystem II stability/assembly factor-like uncharacterized protein